MAVNSSKEYVVPTGVGLMRGIFGPQYGSSNWPSPQQGMFDIPGDTRGAWGAPTDAWNAQRLGLGTLPVPGQLSQALDQSTARYFGNANTPDWQQSWNQWNGTDVTGPDGQTLLSPVHQTGLRVGQDYGVGRDAQGNVAGPAGGDIFKGYTYTQNKLAQNPNLDPTNQINGYNAMMKASPYAMPNPADYTNNVSAAIGGAGAADFYGQRGLQQNQGLAANTNFDQYGLRGIQQTNDLATQNLNKLMKNIDTQSQLTLSNQLPEVQQTMEAAGMGRSGAAQQQMLQAQQQILEQANRDKQSTLANFQGQTLDRQAQAINLATQQGYGGLGQQFGAQANAMNVGSQIGAQGQGQFSNLMGNAALQGLGNQYSANQANRQGQINLYGQAQQNENQRYGLDSTNYLQALTQGGQYQNAALEQERLGQSSALNDWLGLQNQRTGQQTAALNQMLTQAAQVQQNNQGRLNQQLQASTLPLSLQLQIATGTTGGAPVGYAPVSPWTQVAAQSLPSLIGALGNYNNPGRPPQDNLNFASPANQ